MSQGNIASGIYDLPGNVQSQDLTAPILSGTTIGGDWLPVDVYVPPTPPVFRTETEQIDLMRIVLLIVGVIIGAKVLGK